VDHRNIQQVWTIRPDFQHWPPQRQSAVLWIMAHIVQYRLLTQRRTSLLDYVDFMRRARWKYQNASKPRVTGRYLDVIDWPQYWSETFRQSCPLSPPPPGTCEFFFTFRIPRLEDTLHKPMCLILVSFLPAMTHPMCKK